MFPRLLPRIILATLLRRSIGTELDHGLLYLDLSLVISKLNRESFSGSFFLIPTFFFFFHSALTPLSTAVSPIVIGGGVEGRRKWSFEEVGRVLAGIGMEYCG